MAQVSACWASEKLGLDDLVRARQSSAKVLCANQQSAPSPRAIRLCGKFVRKANYKRLDLDGVCWANPWWNRSAHPYIISPRRTLLLDDKPLIRWNAVPNATRYTVRLREPSGVIWQTEVKQVEVRYSGTPVLQPGVGYALIVEADTGASSTEEGVPGWGFN
jgi:hypothetical protein